MTLLVKSGSMLYSVTVTAGVVFLLIASGSLVAGLLFKETALLVFGLLFFTILVYCLGACLAVSAAYRKRAGALGADFAPSVAAAGEPVTVLLTGTVKRFWTPPAILARYMIKLKTLDGRIIEKVFLRDFFTQKNAMLAEEKRGAYFGQYDYLLVCDIFGFFRRQVKIKSRQDERFQVYPLVNRETPINAKNPGGGERTVKNARVLSDDLIEQRQYIPGDDPRRINWKLYGHSEELFIREGEKWGEPLSEIIIVIDSGADDTGKKNYIFKGIRNPGITGNPSNPNSKNRQETVDDLCGRGLEIAVAAAHTASSVTVYYRGGGETGRRWTQDMDKRGLYALFALPFAAKGKTAEQGLPGRDKINGKNGFIMIKDARPREGSEAN